MHFSLPESFYLFGTFHGLFMAAALLTSGKAHRGTVYLSWLILLFSFYLFENVLYSSGYIRNVPWLFLTTLPLTFLIGPLFYFYVRKSTDIYFQLRPVHFVHLVPCLAQATFLLPFYRLDPGVKNRIYESTVNNTQDWTFNAWFAVYIVYFILACAYFIASLRLVERTAKPENPRLRWLKQASLAMLVYLVIAMLLSSYLLVDGSLAKTFYHVNLILQTLLIQLVGYTAFVKPAVFHAEEPETRKYRFSSLSPQTMETYRASLLALMQRERPYLDPEVTADHLAAKLRISKHNFSQLLNEHLHTSFYDFLNDYRVRKAKELLLQDEYREAKIFHVAYDSGFSSKSTFLRSFKKITGQTPSEFKAVNRLSLATDH